MVSLVCINEVSASSLEARSDFKASTCDSKPLFVCSKFSMVVLLSSMYSLLLSADSEHEGRIQAYNKVSITRRCTGNNNFSRVMETFHKALLTEGARKLIRVKEKSSYRGSSYRDFNV